MYFAFISRHEPTAEQSAMAEQQGITLIHVGDTDAFTVTPGWVDNHGEFDGVIVVHPAASMRLCGAFLVGVFENATRPGVDGNPQFSAKALHVYDLRDETPAAEPVYDWHNGYGLA